MIGLQHLHISPRLMRRFSQIDRFNGRWSALDDHTTGLNLLSDVAKHGERLDALLQPLQHRALTPDIANALHASFAAEEKGQIRTQPLMLDILRADKTVAGSLETAQADDILPLYTKLLTWVEDSLMDEAYHPLLIISVFTAVFLQIAPYQHASVRVARFLMILLMLKSGYRYAPFASFEQAFADHADTLYEALKATQDSLESGKPDWQPWLSCFVEILCHHFQQLEAQIDGTNAAEQLAGMPDLSIKLMDHLHAHKRATMKELIFATEGRRSTIKLRLQELIDLNLIIRHGAGRGVWYSLV